MTKETVVLILTSQYSSVYKLPPCFFFRLLCRPASVYNHLKIKPTRCTYFLINIFLFSLLYMFRTSICPSSGELTVSMRHWYLSLCMGGCSVCCSIQSDKYQCRIDTVSSPDDGHIDVRNM